MEEIERKKGSAVISNFMSKATDLGKKVAGNVQHGSQVVTDSVRNTVQTLSEKSKTDSYERRIKKYNPLFPKQYRSKSFNRPNMVVIRDDAERRGIDVCEGAIGWLGSSTGIEVLYLYDEFVKNSGITFVPAPMCGAIYYVDNFDRNKYIRVDCIFNISSQEKVSELEHIAFCLGAKSCVVELEESVIEHQTKNRTVKTNIAGNAIIDKHDSSISNTTNANYTVENKQITKRKVVNNSKFKGNQVPTMPTLKWFKNDQTIKNLIDMRLSDSNYVESKSITLKGSSSSTISHKTAADIDFTVNQLNRQTDSKIVGNMQTKLNLVKNVQNEIQSSLIFNIEF